MRVLNWTSLSPILLAIKMVFLVFLDNNDESSTVIHNSSKIWKKGVVFFRPFDQFVIVLCLTINCISTSYLFLCNLLHLCIFNCVRYPREEDGLGVATRFKEQPPEKLISLMATQGLALVQASAE